MKKIILTESDKKQILSEREQAIINNFHNTFNRIKRLDEDEMQPMNQSPEVQNNNQNLSPQEQKILADILGNGSLNEDVNSIIDKVKMYASKGLMTASIMAALLATPNISNAQKMQIKQAAQTTKTTQAAQPKSIEKPTIDYQSLTPIIHKFLSDNADYLINPENIEAFKNNQSEYIYGTDGANINGYGVELSDVRFEYNDNGQPTDIKKLSLDITTSDGEINMVNVPAMGVSSAYIASKIDETDKRYEQNGFTKMSLVDARGETGTAIFSKNGKTIAPADLKNHTIYVKFLDSNYVNNVLKNLSVNGEKSKIEKKQENVLDLQTNKDEILKFLRVNALELIRKEEQGLLKSNLPDGKYHINGRGAMINGYKIYMPDVIFTYQNGELSEITDFYLTATKGDIFVKIQYSKNGTKEASIEDKDSRKVISTDDAMKFLNTIKSAPEKLNIKR